MAKLEVLNPLGKAELEQAPLAPRLPDLKNKRIGLLWNGNVTPILLWQKRLFFTVS